MDVPGPPTAPTRTVHCADALQWLAQSALPADHAVLTSLPDTSELRGLSFAQWREWFVDAARRVVAATPPDGAAVFFQSDVLRDGRQIDKAFLVQQGAAAAGAELVWHKIVCRAPAGTVTPGRPAFAHLLCVSQRLRAAPAAGLPDVLPAMGQQAWSRGMGLEAALAAVRWLRDAAAARVVVAPFCGRGTALAVANALGLDAIGIERSPARAERARTLAVGLTAGCPVFTRSSILPTDRPDPNLHRAGTDQYPP